jgi:hypothetical protein
MLRARRGEPDPVTESETEEMSDASIDYWQDFLALDNEDLAADGEDMTDDMPIIWVPAERKGLTKWTDTVVSETGSESEDDPRWHSKKEE